MSRNIKYRDTLDILNISCRNTRDYSNDIAAGVSGVAIDLRFFISSPSPYYRHPLSPFACSVRCKVSCVERDGRGNEISPLRNPVEQSAASIPHVKFFCLPALCPAKCRDEQTLGLATGEIILLRAPDVTIVEQY